MFSDGSSGIAGAETGYSTLGRHAGMEHDLSANVVRAKAKMSEKVVRHEYAKKGPPLGGLPSSRPC